MWYPLWDVNLIVYMTTLESWNVVPGKIINLLLLLFFNRFLLNSSVEKSDNWIGNFSQADFLGELKPRTIAFEISRYLSIFKKGVRFFQILWPFHSLSILVLKTFFCLRPWTSRVQNLGCKIFVKKVGFHKKSWLVQQIFQCFETCRWPKTAGPSVIRKWRTLSLWVIEDSWSGFWQQGS